MSSSTINVLYFVNAYKEPLAQVEAVIKAINAIQQSPAPIMLVYDGERPENGRKLAPATLFRNDNAKQGHEKPGYWTHEMLRLFLLTKRELFIKCDPDTQWLRRLNLDPCFAQPGCYGRIVTGVQDFPYVHGGCLALDPASAQTIVDSGLLLNFVREEGFSSDQMLGKVCHELGIGLFVLEGVGILGQPGARVVHP